MEHRAIWRLTRNIKDLVLSNELEKARERINGLIRVIRGHDRAEEE
jgi:hemerythrin superfamily protein